MRKLGNLLSGIFLLLVFISSVTFAYYNSSPVIVSIGSWQFPPQALSVWIIGAFVSGALLGLLIGMGAVKQLKSRAEIRRLNKELAAAKQEVNQLRTLSLKDLG